MTLQPSSTVPVIEAAAVLEERLIKMVAIERIRYAHFREGSSIRELARAFHHSRTTIRRALEDPGPWTYRRTRRRSAPVMDQVAHIVESWLEGDERVHHKQHHTARRIWQRLVAEHGFAGGEPTVRAWVRAHRRASLRGVTIPLAHDLGLGACHVAADRGVEAFERDGVDGEKVGRQDAGSLRPQEVAPAQAEPAPGRIEPRAGEDPADRRGRDPDAETGELAPDPRVPPARVLAGEAQDQGRDVRTDGRPTPPPSGVRPAPGHQATMPAQQGLGPDDEAGPASPREQARGRGEKDPVGIGQFGPGHLPAQDRELMTQHDDLKIRRAIRPKGQRHQSEEASGEDVQQPGQHGLGASGGMGRERRQAHAPCTRSSCPSSPADRHEGMRSAPR